MNIEIANRLVELRKRNNLSQEALAEKLGISRQAVSKWERAEASPDTDNLILLARLYNISLDALLMTGNELHGFKSSKETGRIDQSEPEPMAERAGTDSTEGDGSTSRERSRTDSPEAGRASSTEGARTDSTKGDGTGSKERFGTANTGRAGIGSPEGSRISSMEGSRIGSIEGGRTGSSEGVRISSTEVVQRVSESSAQRELESASQRASEPVVIIEEERTKFDYGILRHFPIYIVAVMAFVILGAIWNAWHPGWMLLLLPPIWQTAIMALEKKDARVFAYPVLVVLLYLCLGFFGSLWHPGWIIFLTIPLYYPLVNYFRRLYKMQKKELDDILQETKKR